MLIHTTKIGYSRGNTLNKKYSELNSLLKALAFAANEASPDALLVITRAASGALNDVIGVEWEDHLVLLAQFTEITLVMAALTGAYVIDATSERIH